MVFDTLYRTLGRITIGVLLAALGIYGVTLICALLGLSAAVASLSGIAASVAWVFLALLGVFLVTSIVAAVIRRLDRQK
jgi:hypothetical protein